MSLRVWLPLNGDLRNNGLSDVTVTNSNATVDTAGKIGSCYSFNGSANLSATGYTDFGNTYTVSLWFYCTSISSNRAFICTRNATGAGFSLFLISGKLRIDSGVVNSTATQWTTNYTAPLNTWHHLTIIRNGGDVSYYVDGVFQEVKTITYSGNYGNVVTIGCSQANGSTIGNYFAGRMNDVRIYDHALSPKEVKLISQGLVAHYQLNSLNGQENLFTWQNKGDSVITLGNYSSVGSFTQFSNSLTFDPSTTVGQKYTISFWARSPNGKTDLRIYNQNGNPRYFKFTSVVLTTDLNTEWQYFTHTVTNSDVGSGDTTDAKCRRIEIYAPSKMGVQVKKIKVENGETATIWSPAPSDSHYSDLGYNDTTVHDTSGYDYNGVNYSATISTDSPRCLTSTEFDGSTKYIEFPNLSFMPNMLPNEWTFSFWVYNQDSGGRSILFSDYQIDITGSAFCFEKTTDELLRIGYSGSFDRTVPDSTLTVNAWTHIAVTKTTANLITVYRNGVQIDSYTNANCKSDGVKYRMGRDSRTGSTMFKGKLSDFRIYTTALSADDVKTLYNAPVSITNKGAMTTQGEFNEHTNI